MNAIIGAILVLGCVFGGFAAHGGNLLVIWQPSELVIIGGAAIGHLVISSSPALLKEVMHQILIVLKGKEPSKNLYQDLLLLIYELTKTAKGNLLALEPHIENPESSDIFNRYPNITSNHHAVEFLCDTLKVQISSPMSPFDLEELMDKDMAAAHAEEYLAFETVNRISDALPGLGIVAAVLGVVNTMGKLTQGKEVIGHSVGAALVGTLIGILACYGFAQPLAAKINDNISKEGKFLEVIKVGLLAFAKDCSPKVCVEFSRRSISPGIRPSFAEVDELTSNIKK